MQAVPLFLLSDFYFLLSTFRKAPSLRERERRESENPGKVSGRLGHGCDIQIDIRSVESESANPSGVRNCPIALAAGIGGQTRNNVVVGTSRHAEIDKGKGLGRAESPRASRARESGMRTSRSESELDDRT